MKLDDAIIRAKDVGLDLIEVSPNAKPPVAKILNYGKLKYEEKSSAYRLWPYGICTGKIMD